MVPLGILVAMLPYFVCANVEWIMQCAREGVKELWKPELPLEGSTAERLVICMVNHVMTSTYSSEDLQIVPMDKDWCLPIDFLVASRSCEGFTTFNPFEPVRYCVDQEGFPPVGEIYSQDFQNITSSDRQSTFYYSSRFVFAMCAYLDALRSSRACLVEVCANASHRPSQTPSVRPSLPPSSQPSSSHVPSFQPTNSSSESPTAYPTAETPIPSNVPSTMPSWYPTFPPTAIRSMTSNEPTLHIQVRPYNTKIQPVPRTSLRNKRGTRWTSSSVHLI